MVFWGEKKQKLLKKRNEVLFSQGPSLPKEPPGKLGLLRLSFPLVVEEARIELRLFLEGVVPGG